MKKILIALLIVALLSSCAPNMNEDKTETTVPETSIQESEEIETSEPKATLSDLDKYGIKDLGDQIELTDTEGNIVVLPKNPQRVVCGYNSYVDLWYKLGGSLVGKIKPSKDKPVPQAEGVEVIGDNKALSEEAIIALKPDLFIVATANNQLTAAETVKNSGVPTLIVDAKNFSEYLKLVRVFSAILNDEEAYQTFGVQLEQEVKAIISRVPSDKNPRVLLMNNTSTAVNVSTSENMTGEMLKDLGAINLADDFLKADDSKTYSLEQILVDDPDFIFLREMGSDSDKVKEVRQKEIEESPIWQSLSAVKNGHYQVLDKDLYTFKPNERYAEAYLSLAKLLYPETFK